MLALYAVGCVTALLLWVERPALFIASDQLYREDMSVFTDYAALVPAYFELIFALAAIVVWLITRSPLHRMAQMLRRDPKRAALAYTPTTATP